MEITKEYHFSAAHMLPGHPKCGRLHGHNYKIEVTIEASTEGPHNWVLDFGVLDKIVKPIIAQLDHRFILTDAQEVNGPKSLWHGENAAHEHVVHIGIPSSSAESLAEWFADVIQGELPIGVNVSFVTVWETPKARATYALPSQ